MFLRDPFDIAPHASRHTRASWMTLVLGLVSALVCASLLGRSLQSLQRAEQASRKDRELAQAQAEAEAVARHRRADPTALERGRAQRRLQQVLRMSWSGLFDALESAGQHVDGGVSIISLAPVAAQGHVAEVTLTALAVSEQVMLQYIRTLQKDPHVREVRLSTQQPAVNGAVPVIRFQFSMWWQALPPVSGDNR
jgi:hypothetical protein